MAEIVQQRIEDRIPELEQLERVGLFTRKEVKAMVKKVSALEYKLHRRIISKEDFITYIQYEINVLELIKKRRSRIGYTFKREEIEFTIIHRINNVFRRATAKWKDDVQLWLSYIVFCKKWNTTTQLSKVFSSMLAIHPDKPAFWIMAAKWEMEDRTSSESARLLFLRALRFHPDNQKLYQEYFRMELMHAEKLRKEQKALEQAKMDLGEYEFSEEIMKAELARVIYKDAIQKIKGADFLLSFLSIARLFDFTKEMQDEILQDLQSLHADDPLTWDFMAKRELEAESLPSPEHESKQTKALEVGRGGEVLRGVQEAVTTVPTEAMWQRYVTFCYERFKRKSNNEELKQKRREKALAVFQRAHESLLLAESLYKQWLQVLLAVGRTESAAEVAVAAARRFSQSLDTWQSCLQVLVSVRSHDVPTLFEEALAHIKPKESLPLWLLRVEWTEETQSLEDTEAFFQKGLLSLVPAISVAMKEKYLDWCYRTGGVKKAKKVFTSLQESRPFSLAFFQKMIKIEKEQETCKMQNLREYYERALREFGSEEDNLWLEYIKEELNHPQGKPENCGKIHWRAMRVLQGERVERFIAKYTLAQTGHL